MCLQFDPYQMCAFSSTKIKCVPSYRTESDVCLQFDANQMCAFSSTPLVRCVPSFLDGTQMISFELKAHKRFFVELKAHIRTIEGTHLTLAGKSIIS